QNTSARKALPPFIPSSSYLRMRSEQIVYRSCLPKDFLNKDPRRWLVQNWWHHSWRVKT
ncbi:unnamed protein product, partial [Brassica napus]